MDAFPDAGTGDFRQRWPGMYQYEDEAGRTVFQLRTPQMEAEELAFDRDIARRLRAMGNELDEMYDLDPADYRIRGIRQELEASEPGTEAWARRMNERLEGALQDADVRGRLATLTGRPTLGMPVQPLEDGAGFPGEMPEVLAAREAEEARLAEFSRTTGERLASIRAQLRPLDRELNQYDRLTARLQQYRSPWYEYMPSGSADEEWTYEEGTYRLRGVPQDKVFARSRPPIGGGEGDITMDKYRRWRNPWDVEPGSAQWASQQRELLARVMEDAEGPSTEMFVPEDTVPTQEPMGVEEIQAGGRWRPMTVGERVGAILRRPGLYFEWFTQIRPYLDDVSWEQYYRAPPRDLTVDNTNPFNRENDRARAGAISGRDERIANAIQDRRIRAYRLANPEATELEYYRDMVSLNLESPDRLANFEAGRELRFRASWANVGESPLYQLSRAWNRLFAASPPPRPTLLERARESSANNFRRWTRSVTRRRMSSYVEYQEPFNFENFANVEYEEYDPALGEPYESTGARPATRPTGVNTDPPTIQEPGLDPVRPGRTPGLTDPYRFHPDSAPDSLGNRLANAVRGNERPFWYTQPADRGPADRGGGMRPVRASGLGRVAGIGGAVGGAALAAGLAGVQVAQTNTLANQGIISHQNQAVQNAGTITGAAAASIELGPLSLVIGLAAGIGAAAAGSAVGREVAYRVAPDDRQSKQIVWDHDTGNAPTEWSFESDAWHTQITHIGQGTYTFTDVITGERRTLSDTEFQAMYGDDGHEHRVASTNAVAWRPGHGSIDEGTHRQREDDYLWRPDPRDYHGGRNDPDYVQDIANWSAWHAMQGSFPGDTRRNAYRSHEGDPLAFHYRNRTAEEDAYLFGNPYAAIMPDQGISGWSPEYLAWRTAQEEALRIRLQGQAWNAALQHAVDQAQATHPDTGPDPMSINNEVPTHPSAALSWMQAAQQQQRERNRGGQDGGEVDGNDGQDGGEVDGNDGGRKPTQAIMNDFNTDPPPEHHHSEHAYQTVVPNKAVGGRESDAHLPSGFVDDAMVEHIADMRSVIDGGWKQWRMALAREEVDDEVHHNMLYHKGVVF